MESIVSPDVVSWLRSCFSFTMSTMGGWLPSRSPSSVALLLVGNWSYYEVTDLAGDGVRGEVAKYCVLYGELDGCTRGLLR